jgi:dihydroorotase
MITDLTLTDAKILRYGEIVECSISIDEGRIFKIGKLPSLPKSSETISIRGKLVLPGLIDVHVHLRDLELSYKEDFQSGTSAAAAGGFTTVLDMPNTKPPTNSSNRLKEKIWLAKRRILVNVGFYGAFPERVEEIEDMAKAGAIAFKVNLYNPITKLQLDDTTFLKALEKAMEAERVVTIHTEDREMVRECMRDFRKKGDSSIAAFLKAHSVEAETNALYRVVGLQRKSKARTHIAHVTLSDSIEIIRDAKKGGASLTCEVTPHHLLLTEKQLKKIGGIALTVPPLRPLFEVLYLWEELRRGTIDIIASDHAPHSLHEKSERDIWKVSPGIPGLETTLPLLLTRFHDGYITLTRIHELLAINPAKIFGLKRKGRIRPGFDADFVIVDLKRKFVIDSSRFHSKAHYSPFDGNQVVGMPIKTIVGGNLVMEEGEIVAKPGIGKIILT